MKGAAQRQGMEASCLGTSTVKIDKERWFLSHTPVTNRERPNSRGIRAWGVRTRQDTPPLKNHWDRDDPRVMSQREICMHGT